MSYDIKCAQLANDFLEDHPAVNTLTNQQQLAQEIQDAIEGFIEGLEAQ